MKDKPPLPLSTETTDTKPNLLPIKEIFTANDHHKFMMNQDGLFKDATSNSNSNVPPKQSDEADAKQCYYPSNPKRWCHNLNNIHRECWCFISILMIAAYSILIIVAFKIDLWHRWQGSTEETEFEFDEAEKFYSTQVMTLFTIGAVITGTVICFICGGIIFGWSYKLMY